MSEEDQDSEEKQKGYGNNSHPQGNRIAHAIRPHVEASRASSRGTFFPTLDYSNWRVKTKEASAIKLDDAAKGRYLQTLAQTGKRGLASAAAGVSHTCIQRHMKEDPEFIEACEVAITDYREQRVLLIENQALAGFEETIFSPTGEMATRQRYETQLRLAVLKAYAPDIYTEKKEIDVTFKGGAIVIPLPAAPEEWDKMFEKHGSEMGHLITEGVDVPTARENLVASGHELDINKNKRHHE